MLDRLSANALLKSVIVVMAAAVIVMLAANAWASWQRLALENRILAVADVSGFAFKRMHNMRPARSSTFRSMNAPEPIAADLQAYLRSIREAEMPALRSAVELLPTIEFAGKTTLLPKLQQSLKTLTALQSESW